MVGCMRDHVIRYFPLSQMEAGAPAEVVVEVTIAGDTMDWEVVWVNKRPTRLAESIFFSFVPAVSDPKGWSLRVLGSEMDPTDTLGKPGLSSRGR